MKNKKESLILGRILQKIAPQIGASVLLEPKWGMVGQITFKNGQRSYFRYNTMDINSVGSSDIAKDKDYASFFMATMGYPVIPDSKAFFRKDWAEVIDVPENCTDAAYEHALKIGLPVIVKPNSGSQGSGVALVCNKREFYRAMRVIFKQDKIALVQKYVIGRDYRLVVLDNKVISAYERRPLSVVGDGKYTIKELLAAKQARFAAIKRDTRINMDDPRITAKLKRQRLTFRSVLEDKQLVYLLDNANLSSGGDSIDIGTEIHPFWNKIAVKLTKDMGLRLCGVDLMVSGNISEEPGQYWIIEINAAPGLDHYVKMGAEQEKIVEDLYLEVLKHIEKR